MKRLISSLLLLVGVLSLLPGAAETAAPPRGEDDTETIVCLGEKGPVLVRLHLRLEGQAHRARFDQLLDELFAYADSDKDGVLSPAEIKRLPPVAALGNVPFFAGLSTNEKEDRPPARMTRADLAGYYRKARLVPFQLSFQDQNNGALYFGGGSQNSPDQINARLFELLDTNGDGVLSREELEAAPKILSQLDVDEDEMLTVAELLGRGGRTSSEDEVYFGGIGQTNDGPVVEKPLHLVTGLVDAELGQRLLKTYGEKGAKSLDASTPGISRELFARLDRNHDGVLDADELARYAAVAEPDVEVTVRLTGSGQSNTMRAAPRPVSENKVEEVAKGIGDALNNLFAHKDNRPPIELHPSRRPLPPGVKVSKQDQGVKLELGTMVISLKVGGGNGGMFGDFDIKPQYRILFQMADTDGNGYIDKKEADKSIFFRGAFEAMDADGDGKLFEKEVMAYLDSMSRLRKQATKCCLTLSAVNNGESLFDLADTNRDGRLSIRELRQMSKALLKLDSNGDGKLSRSEVPRQYDGSFERGPGSGALGAFATFGYVSGKVGSGPAAKGPLWFRKMDRNRDGDVSRKEWLGSEEDFRLIDTDGDGLISLEEAEAYEKKMRGKK